MPPLVRSWLKPVGCPAFSLAALAWLATSLFIADPQFNYMCLGPVVLFVLLWPSLAAIIGLRFLLRRGLLAHYKRQLSDFGSEARRIWWIVGAFAALNVSTIFALPTRLWFLPFAAMFESAADEMRAATPPAAWSGQAPMPSKLRWVGVWRVRVQGVPGDPRGGVIACYTDTGSTMGTGTGFVHVDGRGEMIGYNAGEAGWIIGDWYYFTTD